MSTSRHIDPQALPHFEPAHATTTPRQRCQQYEFLEEQFRETWNWLRERPEVEAALRRQMAAAARPKWVTDGLMLLAARRTLRARGAAHAPP